MTSTKNHILKLFLALSSAADKLHTTGRENKNKRYPDNQKREEKTIKEEKTKKKSN